MGSETRKVLAARYFSRTKERRILSVSHFNSQWLEFIYLIGSHPIVFSQKRTGNVPGVNFHFEFRFFSWITLYTITCTTLTILYFLHWFIELHYGGGVQSILDESYRILLAAQREETVGMIWNETTIGESSHSPSPHVDKLAKLCLEGVSKFVPLSGIGYMLSGIFSTRDFMKFLNGANDIENRVRQLFPEVVDISLAHLHLYRRRIVFSNCIMFIFFTILQAPTITSIIRYYTYHPMSLFDSKLFLLLLMTSFIAFHGIFDDTKSLSVLKIVEEYFQQANSAQKFFFKLKIIDGVNNYRFKKSGTTCFEDVQKWRSLVHLVRKQAKIAVFAFQGSTIFSLIGMHLVLTTSIYLIYCVINMYLPDFVGSYGFGSFIYCSVLYARLYLKAVLAESITKKENELAETLRLFGECSAGTNVDAGIETRCQVEVSFITDSIVSKPTRCELSSCITLKVALLMGVFRNVSTYAVALIQLDTVQRSLLKIIEE